MSKWISSLHPDRSGDYLILENFISPSSRILHDDVTMVTQCSVNHLHHLPELANRWQGPMSIGE